MKKFLLSIALLAASFAANAQHSVALADAVWNVDDMQYYDHAGYKKNSTHSSNTTSYIYANWCVDNESKRKTLRGSAAYIPSIHPNKYTLSQASTPNTVKYVMDDTLAIRMYHNAGNYKQFIMLPKISDAAYTNLELEFYARRGVTDTETDASKLSIGYIVLNTLDDTLAVFDNVVNLQSLNITNGTYANGYNKYTISLAALPINAQVVFYEGTAESNILYLDNISIKAKGGVTPEPEPEPEPEPTTFTVTYNLVGCTGGLNEDDEENPTSFEEGAEDLDMYFTLGANRTWDNVQITIMMGDTEIPDGLVDYSADPSYMAEVGDDNQLNIYVMGIAAELDANIVVTITAPEAFNFPTEFTPATFEDVTVGSNGVYYDPTLSAGNNAWLNGSFKFYTYYNAPSYYSDIVVSSLVDPSATADYTNPVSYLYAPTQTPNGSNFAVWNQNYYGIQNVRLDVARTLTGMYVNNTSAVINYLTDSYTTFPADGYYMLTVTGYNGGVQTGTVNCYLVDWRNAANKKTLTDWEWLDLTSLGSVDEINFNVYSDDLYYGWLNIPAYFCFDNLGGAAPSAPTSVENVAVDDVEKQLFNGQLIIRRGEHLYNAAGQMIK